MPTVIDSLIVELKLDPNDFTKGQKDAAASFLKTKEESLSTAKNIEAAGKRGAEFFSQLRTQAIGLFAVFTGGRGVKEFFTHIATNDANVGRLAVTLGTTTQMLAKWRSSAAMVGGSTEDITGSIQMMVQQFQQLAVTGESSLTPFLYSLGVATADASGKMRPFNDILLDIADRFRAMDPTKAGAIGRMMGLGPDMINLLIKGRAELQGILDVQEKLNPVTTEQAKAATDLQKSWALATGAAESLGRTIMTKLTPALMSLLDSGAKTFKELAEGKLISPGSLLDSLLHGTPFRGFGPNTGTYDPKAGTGGMDPKKILADAFAARRAAGGGGAPSGSTAGGEGAAASARPAPGASTPDMKSYAAAIANIESRGSGNYDAVGPVTRSGDRAYGKYQVMGNNIGEWSQAALGKRLSTQEFRASPEYQDAIFNHKFGEYIKKFGNPQDAASAWLTGKPLSAGANLRDVNGTSGADYVRKFNAGIGAGLAATSNDNRTSTANHDTRIGPVNIYTNAKDGAGLAKDFKEAMERNSLAAQVNYGPR